MVNRLQERVMNVEETEMCTARRVEDRLRKTEEQRKVIDFKIEDHAV